jgi:hypothetical protein
MTNPYAAAQKAFFGREAELATLERELTRGASTLAAVMAGRGMGKTSLARELEQRLSGRDDCKVYRWSRTPPSQDEFLRKLGQCLAYEFTGMLFDDEVREAIEKQPERLTVLLLDEVDDLLDSTSGRILLENMRFAWERLEGRLGVVILGGSGLYELLETKVSPFLRNAEFVYLPGLSLEETRRLVREPSGLEVSEDQIDLLWQETAGHPAVLTEIMKAVVDKGVDPARGLLSAVDHQLVQQLETRFFSIWWKNLRPRGQEIYRRLVEHGRPVPETSIAALVGGAAGQWVQVLETTGVLRAEGGELLPRGELFGRWARREHFQTSELAILIPEHIEGLLAPTDAFERELLMAVGRWARGVIEYAGLGLLLKGKRHGAARGNARFMSEAHFQLGLLLALQQHGWSVEAEGWSIGGRSDLKVRRGGDPAARVCIELKIWGRNHLDVVEQVRGYALPSDHAACVVMLDRSARPLLEEYQAQLIQAKGYSVIGEAADRTVMPQLITEHPRNEADPLRVHHFLLQFPSD